MSCATHCVEEEALDEVAVVETTLMVNNEEVRMYFKLTTRVPYLVKLMVCLHILFPYIQVTLPLLAVLSYTSHLVLSISSASLLTVPLSNQLVLLPYCPVLFH